MGRPDFVSPSTPRAAESDIAIIYNSATLSASGAWTRSSIVSVIGVRRITIFADYDPAATSGYPVIVPLVSNALEQPAAGDDSWFQMPVWDGSVTAGALTGTLPTGADYTLSQSQGVALTYGLAVRLAGASAATDEYRQAITLDVTPYRWFHFIAAEVGATGSPGALGAFYATGV
jgi:hypothetical protein